MVKIKKCVYKLLTVVLALLVVLNTSAIGVLAESVDSNEVTPGPEDYAFDESTGTITGLKAEYLKYLTDEQKQNIRLVIPENISGVDVKAIGEFAFSQYNGRPNNYIYLDISSAKGLECIKENAFRDDANLTGKLLFSNKLKKVEKYSFYNCSKLSGDLTLPDSVEEIGDSSFRNCSGLNGNLTISNSMKVIADNAFYNCGCTGELEIPSSVEKIGDSAFRQGSAYNGFTGVLTIPASLKSIGTVTFTNQRGITGVDLSMCTLDSIGNSVFKGTGLKGSLCIPDTIKKIGDGTFKDTFLETVYLPKGIDVEKSNSFDSCKKLNAIVCEPLDYDGLSSKLSNEAKNKLGYPIEVRFDDGNGGEYPPKECLYNLPYNFTKAQDGVWSADSNYKFPEVKVSSTKAWGLATSASQVIKETDKASQTTLYAIETIIIPKITVGKGIDKVYDGKAETLSVKVEHPSFHTYKGAKPGNVICHYTWYWSTITPIEIEASGFDLNTYEVTDVRMPEYAINCTVRVISYKVGDDYKAKKFDTQYFNFLVNLRQAEPMVHPVVAHDTFYADGSDDNLPAIALSDGDTEGTIEWKENQTTEKGEKSYEWVFTPAKNAVGSSNYTEKRGTIKLTGKDKDGSVADVKDEVGKLPNIPDGTEIKEEDKTSILDAFMHYNSLPQDVKSEIDSTNQNKIYESLEKLPSINATVDAAAGFAVDNKLELIKNITTEDALSLKAKAINNYEIQLVAESKEPEEGEKEAINDLGDITLFDSFEVKVQKKIKTSDGDERVEVLNEVKKPIKMVFDVPNDLRSAGSGVKLYLIRIHTVGDKVTAEILHDEDTNPNTITVTSDKFSKYIIGYEGDLSASTDTAGGSGDAFSYTITAFAGDHGVITPSGTAYAYYGSTKTFSFTPDEGYKVADVIVDGASVGAVSSYTFENITKAHTIAVTFELIADDQDRIINGVKATTIKASSSARKGSITVKWKKSTGFKVDYFQVFRSTKKNSGYGNKAFYTTKTGTQKSYKNTKKLRKGTRYYYKVRGVRTIDGVKVCTKWSNKAIRIAK